MTSGVSFEILDLRHFSSQALRPLMNAEILAWQERLHWDYQPSARMLMQYLDSHILPGYVAIDPTARSPDTRMGRVTGYAFFVYEDAKAVIGDVFVLPEIETAREIELSLLNHSLETLLATPQVHRIESQLLLHPAGEHAEVFDRAGFERHPRLFMAKTLTSEEPAYEPLSSGLEMRGWRDEDLHASGRLIAEAYLDHPDSLINDQYRTIGGSMRFLHNIVRFPGCGVFSAQATFVVIDRSTHQMVALALGSRISPTSGHITQICVHPSYRRQGLARKMLAAVAAQFRRMGLSEISLTVTERNRFAVKLYLSQGYNPVHTFDAAVYTA